MGRLEEVVHNVDVPPVHSDAERHETQVEANTLTWRVKDQ